MSSLAAPSRSCAPEPALRLRPVASRNPKAESSRVSVTTLGAQDAEAWDRYVLDHPFGTIFHTTAWQRAVETTFGHAPRHLLARRDGRVVGVLPLTRVNSLLTGRALVSVPYAVGGGAITNDDDVARALLTSAIQCAGDDGAARIDLRSEVAVFDDLSPIDGYVGFRRALPARSCDVLASLPRKQRAVVRHARRRYRLTVVEGDEHLDTLWHLYSVNMRRLGSINYPIRFFRAIVEETPGQHRISIVMGGGNYGGYPGGTALAGLLSLRFNDVVMPYFHGCVSAARECGASHLAYCELMEWAVANGCRIFDFGRSRRDNVGSYEFKRLMGFEPRPLGYQRWTAPEPQYRADLNPSSASLKGARRAWACLPLWLTRPAGAWLSRHLPG